MLVRRVVSVMLTLNCRQEIEAPTWSAPLLATRRPCAQYISLKHLLWDLRSERIKQVNKVKKLLLRLERLRWRHLALLRFILVVDLLDLPAVDTQTPSRQHLVCHLVV